MKIENIPCPECDKTKIYQSQANWYVCGNKKCGRIFRPYSSEEVVITENIIKNLERVIKLTKKEMELVKQLNEEARKT